jgi:hypothetical protein
MDWLTRHNLHHWQAIKDERYFCSGSAELDVSCMDMAWSYNLPTFSLYVPSQVRNADATIVGRNMVTCEWLNEEELGL